MSTYIQEKSWRKTSDMHPIGLTILQGARYVLRRSKRVGA
jgi:hypothetical protein